MEWKASGRELEAADEAEADTGVAEGETTEGETTEGETTEGETTGAEGEAGGKRKASARAAAAASGPGGLAALLGSGGGGGGGGGGSPAALLQVATADWAVLFDLIALCGPGSSSSAAAAPGGEQEAAAADATAATTPLDAVLLPLFSRTPAEGGCLVLGFGLSGTCLGGCRDVLRVQRGCGTGGKADRQGGIGCVPTARHTAARQVGNLPDEPEISPRACLLRYVLLCTNLCNSLHAV